MRLRRNPGYHSERISGTTWLRSIGKSKSVDSARRTRCSWGPSRRRPGRLPCKRVARKIGESGGVPAGASCNVNPNGTVTIQDARERRRYQIIPAEAPAAAARYEAAGAEHARDAGRCAVTPRRTHPSQRNGSSARSAASRRPTAKRATPLERTAADQPTASHGRKQADSCWPRETRSRRARARFTSASACMPCRFLAGRHRREARDQAAASRAGRDQQGAWREVHPYRAVRPHLEGAPEHAPVVRHRVEGLEHQHRDRLPTRGGDRQSEAPRVSSVPPPPTEDRLAVAFEACHDLLFLKNRAEALEFAVHLLEELVPSRSDGRVPARHQHR